MDAVTFLPPPDVVAAAARGLELRRRFGRGGTRVGIRRAFRLVRGDDLDLAEMKVISAWFARHGAMRRSSKRPWGNEDDPSAGWIAWLLWGGDAGRAWADAATGRSIPVPDKFSGNGVLARSLREAALI